MDASPSTDPPFQLAGDYTPLTMDLSDFRNILEQKSVALCLEVAGKIHLRMEPLIGVLKERVQLCVCICMCWRLYACVYLCVCTCVYACECVSPLAVPGLLEHNPLPGMPTVPTSPQGSFGRLFGGRQRLVTADMVVDEVCACVYVHTYMCWWFVSALSLAVHFVQ